MERFWQFPTRPVRCPQLTATPLASTLATDTKADQGAVQRLIQQGGVSCRCKRWMERRSRIRGTIHYSKPRQETGRGGGGKGRCELLDLPSLGDNFASVLYGWTNNSLGSGAEVIGAVTAWQVQRAAKALLSGHQRKLGLSSHRR